MLQSYEHSWYQFFIFHHLKNFFMEAKNILKTHYLDLLFENKNKDYGAYPLRKFYNDRIKKSLGITLALVLVFAGFQSWRMSKKISYVLIDKPVEVILDPYKENKPDEPEKEKSKTQKIQKQVATVPITPPLIVPDTQVPNSLPTVDEIDTMAIGKIRSAGTADSGFVDIEPGPPGIPTPPSNGDGNSMPDAGDNPIYNPSQMPEFPGGAEALKRFMLRNLMQPDDIEEGQQIRVIAKFVVSKTGEISDIEIVHSGREDLDAEVLRVVKKMPAWKPGLQNGLPVNVYYKIPVSFTYVN